MSAFAAKSFKSHDYALYRPSYSLDFFKYVFRFADLTNIAQEGKTFSILDVGAGPGTCMITFIPYLAALVEQKKINVEKINLIVTDVSTNMLSEAKKNLDKVIDNLGSHKKDLFALKYIESSGEGLLRLLDASSIDLVIAAECVHWLKSEEWLICMQQILKPKTGVLAFWGYVDPVFTGIEKPGDHEKEITKANEFYESFVYEAEGKLGVYWEQPGRRKLRGLCKEANDLVFEDVKNWRDVVTVSRDPLRGDVSISDRLAGDDVDFKVDDKALKMTKTYTLAQFLQYADTWSSSHKWNAEHGEDEKVSSIFYKGLHEANNWGLEDVIEVEFKTYYTLSKKI